MAEGAGDDARRTESGSPRERDEDKRRDDGTKQGDRTDRGSSGGEDKGDKGDKDEAEEKPHKGLLQRPLLLAAMGLTLLVVLIAGVLYWLHARTVQSTDDAFIDTHIVRLAPQISGRVTEVLVSDNARVRAGQPLVRIDSADVATRVAQAQAQKAQAQAQVDNARVQIAVNQAAYQQALSDAAASAAAADIAAKNLARYEALLKLNALAVAQQQLDQARDQARQTAAERDSANKAAKSRLAQITAAETQVRSGEDQVRAAEAVLNEANITFGYAEIRAPVDGHVAQKSVAVGNYVEPGSQLLAIVPDALWVTANFKETQLADIRPGQSATIHVDACPKSKVTGKVQSIERGSGQAFGVLPPENATGNFVKVVQRVPVKIVFDRPPGDCVFGPGMSVEPTVRVR